MMTTSAFCGKNADRPTGKWTEEASKSARKSSLSSHLTVNPLEESTDAENLRRESIKTLRNFLMISLHAGRIANLQTALHVPDGLDLFLAREISFLSSSEPYGLRGCAVVINFEDTRDSKCHRLGRFEVDPSTVSTFEVSLLLRDDRRANLLTLRTLLPRRKAFERLRDSSGIVVSKNVEIVKKKLFRRQAF